MPLGFTFGANEANGSVVIANGLISNPWKNSVEDIDGYQATCDELEQSIRSGVIAKVKEITYASSSSDYGFYLTFDPNSTTAATKEDIKAN